MSRLLLVRHADAGDRAAWQGDDAARPLSARGMRQADALVPLLAPLLGDAVEIRSSPALRCTGTVAPLAQRLGTGVVEDEALFEGGAVARLIRRLPGVAAAGSASVWASHGDVIPAVLLELARGGVDLGDAPRCRKGSTWVLELGEGGRVREARYLERPDGRDP